MSEFEKKKRNKTTPFDTYSFEMMFVALVKVITRILFKIYGVEVDAVKLVELFESRHDGELFDETHIEELSDDISDAIQKAKTKNIIDKIQSGSKIEFK